MRVAYRFTLEAQRLLNAIDLPSIRRARRLLKSAQTVAPDFVPTIAALARSHVMEWLVRAPFEVAPLEFAEQFAKQAIAISPDDHRGYHELGLVRVYRRRLDDGIECLNRAASLCPEDKGVCADLADALVFNGQSREAIAMLDDLVRSFDPGGDYIRWVLAGRPFRPRGLRSDVAADQADEQSGAGVPHLRRRARPDRRRRRVASRDESGDGLQSQLRSPVLAGDGAMPQQGLRPTLHGRSADRGLQLTGS